MGLSKAQSLFPNVPWTGGSDIHVSLARDVYLPAGDPKATILLLRKANVTGAVWKLLQGNFAAFSEWLITGPEFGNLMLVDCWRHLNGQPDSSSENKLINPCTGSRFHRIALAGDLVGGIRFWCDYEYGGKKANFGFRFRIEQQSEEEERTRQRTRETVEQVSEEMEAISEMLFDVAEPHEEAVTKVRESCEFEHY